MDPITALGVASAVLGFLEIGAKIAIRLEELSKVGDVPIAFRDIHTRLPLILSIVASIQESHETLPPDAQRAFEAVVEGCYKQTQQIEKILERVQLATGDSRWRKGLRAALSLIEEPHIKKISANLRDNIELLAMFKIAPSEKPDQQRSSARRQSTNSFPPSYRDSVGVFMVPFVRDDRFIGRDDALKSVDELFLDHARVAITGVGGVGKSQVAIEYAYRFKEAYQDGHVFWIYGGSIPRFYQGYKKIAQAVAIPGWEDPDVSILELVSEWLNKTTTPYLLVVDNADDLLYYWPNKYKSINSSDESGTNLASHLPESRVSARVLITSRDSRIAGRLARPNKPVVLQNLGIEEAGELFHSDIKANGLQPSENEVTRLVEAVDCLPLAITQAASFINENDISVSEYLAALESDHAEEFFHEELDDSRRDQDSINSSFRTWKLSFDQISKQKPRAADFLSLLGMLDRQSIPKWLVKSHEGGTSASVLQSFSLVSCPEGSESFQLHGLCQRFIRLWLKRSGNLQKWQEIALNCVSQAYPTEIGPHEWPVCDALAPHVATLLDYNYDSLTARLDLAHLLCWAGDFDIERGLYQQALTRAKKSLELFKALVPEHDDRLASSMWLYGRLLYYEAKSQSDLLLARDTLQTALDISSPSSLFHAESAFELAYIFYVLNMESECLEMGRHSFECWKSIEGVGGLRTLDEMHDYSLELAVFGHREEALANWREILRLSSKSKADQNTKSIYEWRSRASLAEFQDDAETAEILYAKLVNLGSSIYGKQHVHVLDYRLSHAEQILRLSRPSEALEICQSTLKSCTNKSEWRIAASCYEIMAESCLLENDGSKEEEWRLKCAELHSSHPAGNQKETTNAIEAAGRCLLSNSKHLKAEELFRKVLSRRETELGRDHPRTHESIELLGICQALQARDDEAETFLRALKNSTTFNARVSYNLCIVLWNQQKWSELERRCREALTEQNEFAPDHQEMLTVALEKQDKTQEVVNLKVEHLQIDGSYSRDISRRNPKIPSRRKPIEPRFGRIIHPRSWSA